MKHFLGERLTKLWRDRTGGIFVFAAIAAPVMIGAAGLSVDIGLWYANKRLAQSAVDSAALAGALEYRRSNGVTASIINVVNADALINGFSAANGDTIVVDASTSPRVAVTITRTVPGLLSRVLFTEIINVQARAVARADVNDTCIWSLNPTDEKTIEVSGAADVDLGCGMLANTDDPDGIHKEGSGCLAASEYKVAGGYDDSSNSGCDLDPVPETGIAPADDPLASLPSPSYTNCVGGGPPVNLNGSANYTVMPGVHCTNINVSTSGIVTFLPGIHIFDGAKLNINGSANVEGTEVSFYWSEDSAESDGIDIRGGATVTLSSPTSGVYAGVLVYQDRNTTTDVVLKLNGGSTMSLDGIIYAPVNAVEFTGGSASDSSSIMVIADTVKLGGGGATFLGDFDTSTIMNNVLMLQAQLVE